MPIFLCYDPQKRTTSWTAEKYRSMISEFSRRRIKYFAISSPDELENYLKLYKNEPSSIVFFPADETQRKYLFDRYKKFDINRIIFSHQDVDVAESNFSYVMSDFYGDMELAISHLESKGCKSIALFSANPAAYHDRMRIETYKKFIKHEPLVFPTNGKIYPSLEKLMQCDKQIDAIICINDFVAFCLMLVLDEWDKNWHEKIHILSFSNSILSGLCSPSLSSISLNYAEGGKEVATIHRALEKNNRMAYMHIIMKSLLVARETTAKEKPIGINFSKCQHLDTDEMKKIIMPQAKCMPLEKMLADCDETDLKIIHGILLSNSLTEIGEQLYLSRDSVKYRVKKFKDVLRVDSAAALSATLKKWINPKLLEEMILSIKK